MRPSTRSFIPSRFGFWRTVMVCFGWEGPRPAPTRWYVWGAASGSQSTPRRQRSPRPNDPGWRNVIGLATECSALRTVLGDNLLLTSSLVSHARTHHARPVRQRNRSEAGGDPCHQGHLHGGRSAELSAVSL